MLGWLGVDAESETQLAPGLLEVPVCFLHDAVSYPGGGLAIHASLYQTIKNTIQGAD